MVEQAVAEQPVGEAVAVPRKPRVRSLTLTPELRIAGWWVASRGIVLVTIAMLQWIKKPNGYFTGNEFKSIPALLTTWDGRWYTQVASHGYLLVPGHQSDPAFFPLYPILLRFG